MNGVIDSFSVLRIFLCDYHQVVGFVELRVDEVFELFVVSCLGRSLRDLEFFGGDGLHDLGCCVAEEPCVNLVCSVFEFCGQVVV